MVDKIEKKPKKKGGYRAGSGRKKGKQDAKTIAKRILAEKAREYVVNRIAEELEPILESQIALAKGIFVMKEETEGKGKNAKKVQKIYQQAPDGAMAKYLLDQAIGKASDSLEVGGMNGQPIQVTMFNAAAAKYAKKQKEIEKKQEHDNKPSDSTTDFYIE